MRRMMVLIADERLLAPRRMTRERGGGGGNRFCGIEFMCYGCGVLTGGVQSARLL